MSWFRRFQPSNLEWKMWVIEKFWKCIWIQRPKIHQKQTFFLMGQNLCWPVYLLENDTHGKNQLCWRMWISKQLLSFDIWKWNSHQNLLAVIGFLWWRYCEHEDYASLNEKIMGYWDKFWTEQPAAVWKACHHNLSLEQARNRHVQESWRISKRAITQVKHWFS